MEVSVCRIAHFNAAHRLHNENLSAAENDKLFGKCNHPNYHGHNYKIEVWLTGKINPLTGYVMDLKDLKQLIETEIEDRFDHKNLNLDTAEFKNLNPTAENICVVCWNLLRKKLNPEFKLKVILHETERNLVSFEG